MHCLNPAVLLSPVAEGYIAYDTEANRLHELNPTAALLVELCNGLRTPKEIAAIAAPWLPPDSELAVFQWLAQATEQKVLVEISEDGQRREIRELSPQDLEDLADRLRDEGKVHAAFLCQQHATLLLPNDPQLLRNLGELAHIVGKRQEARQAYEAFLALEPNDAEILHILTSLRDDAPPARVPNACIHQLYQRFSEYYESNMCEELGYEGPLQLRDVIDKTLGELDGISILDLGCGTGLAGMEVVHRASRIVGIDLSPEMIEQAKKRGIYDALQVAEVTEWIHQSNETFDLIMACDTLIYFGDLRQVILPAVKILSPNGVLAFSVERANRGTFQLTDNGRYVHHPDHIRAVATEANLSVEYISENFLRMEYGEEVTGVFVTLRKCG